MSFDVFLQRFEAGDCAQVDRQPVLAVLNGAKYTGPKMGIYRIEFLDGETVDFSAKELADPGNFDGCAFHIHGMSSHMFKFMLEIAKAGDMVILPAMEDFVPILSSDAQQKELPAELAENDPKPVVCGSAEELELLLSDGHAAWQKYRDSVIRSRQEQD